MKLFYVICLLLFSITAKVHAAAPAKPEQRQKSFTAAIFQHDQVADITLPVHIKSCKGRFLTPGPLEKFVPVTAHYYDHLYFYSPLSSFHTLLTRLLLFPRHYFW